MRYTSDTFSSLSSQIYNANVGMTVVEIVQAKGNGVIMEDFGGINGSLAWVIDGATGIQAQQFLSSRSDAAWLANQVHCGLSEAKVDCENLDTLMQEISHHVEGEANKRANLNSLPEYALPSYALALVKLVENRVDYLVLGDCYLVIVSPSGISIHTDESFRRNSMEQRIFNPKIVYNKAKLLRQRRSTMNKIGGYRIGSIDGSAYASLQPQTLSVEAGTQILLCTDGFARAVELYNLYNWHNIFDHSLKTVLASIREFESNRVNTHLFKKSDDVFAIRIDVT